MALRSARSFLKVGLFLGSYCQQLFIILAISTGQECGAGIRYPEMHHSQSKQAVRDFWHIYTTPCATKSSESCLCLQMMQFSTVLFVIFSHGFYLSPPHPVPAGWSCSCKVSDPGKRSPTAKYQSSTRHSLWYSDLKTPAGGSIGKGTGQERPWL